MDNNKNFNSKIFDLVLYRGTSLVFEIVKNGAIPIYLSRKGEINFDPLSLEGRNKNSSINIQSPKKLFQIITNKKNKILYKKNYFLNAYSKVDKKKIKKIFN